ncbi:hypothetical protein [Salininema proteolyticum]|uniref:DUF397 domain-containing protein n=1 Tax=Salininema proteolyticum TaxID=1607685 RepID=A0ABV8TU95_9ACTN
MRTTVCDWADARFVKSNRSNGSGGSNCYMIAVQGSYAAIGDSVLPDVGVIEVLRQEARTFVNLARRGYLSALCLRHRSSHADLGSVATKPAAGTAVITHPTKGAFRLERALWERFELEDGSLSTFEVGVSDDGLFALRQGDLVQVFTTDESTAFELGAQDGDFAHV